MSDDEFDSGVAGLWIRKALGLPCPPPATTRVRPDPRLAVGYVVGYRGGVVAWAGSLKLLASAPVLDEIVVSSADYASYLEAIR